MKKNIKTLAALLIASATFVACSSDNDIIGENQQPVNPTGKYTMTINASKGDGATTRALNLTDHTLNATWSEGEIVEVYQGGSKIGELTAAASTDASTTLTGTFDAAPSTSADLTFYFHTNTTSYSGQDGTLATIASSYDFCAPATVATGDFTVNSANHTISVPAGISFGANQQAIIKFTLKDKANDAAISPSALTVTDGTSTVELTSIPAATYTANGGDNNVLYVAFPAAGSAKTITLTATVGDDTYTYETATAKTFVNGQYYEITVKMTKYVPECSYTAPTLVGGTLTYNGSARALVTGGSATNATIYYSTNGGSSWSTDVPTGTNAGNYTVYYKVVPDDGYTGGVESTSLGTKTINKANGWVSLSSTSSSDWMNYWGKSASVTVNHHGGSLSASKSGGGGSQNLSVSFSGNTMNLSTENGCYDVTVTVYSAATQNYNAASATYTCYY